MIFWKNYFPISNGCINFPFWSTFISEQLHSTSFITFPLFYPSTFRRTSQAFTNYDTRYIASSTENQLDHAGQVHEIRCHGLTGLTRDFRIQGISTDLFCLLTGMSASDRSRIKPRNPSMLVMLWRMSILNLAESPPTSL